MFKTKTKYPEVDNIKEDMSSLKANTIELGKHIKQDGAAKTSELKEVASNRMHELTEQSKEQLKSVEAKVKEKPFQSLAIAFVAGLALNLIMRRK